MAKEPKSQLLSTGFVQQLLDLLKWRRSFTVTGAAAFSNTPTSCSIAIRQKTSAKPQRPTKFAKWGKVTSYTAGGNTVVLQPCDVDGVSDGSDTVQVYIELPTDKAYCSFFAGVVDDVLPYAELDDVRFLLSYPRPYSTTRYDVFQITATNGQGGFDSVRIK